jgi:hypothetical protein
MSRRQQQQAPERELSRADQFNLVFAVITAMACMAWPFTRCHFGTGAFYPFGYIACVIMFCYAGFGECPEAMLVFFLAWLALVVFHRVVTLKRAWAGDYEHSIYCGTPWLVSKICGLELRQEIAAKLVAEPVLLLLVAGLVAIGSPNLAVLLVAVAICSLLRCLIIQQIEMAFDRTQRDAELTIRQRAKRRRQEW